MVIQVPEPSPRLGVAIGAWRFWRRWAKAQSRSRVPGSVSPLVPGTFGDVGPKPRAGAESQPRRRHWCLALLETTSPKPRSGAESQARRRHWCLAPVETLGQSPEQEPSPRLGVAIGAWHFWRQWRRGDGYIFHLSPAWYCTLLLIFPKSLRTRANALHWSDSSTLPPKPKAYQFLAWFVS